MSSENEQPLDLEAIEKRVLKIHPAPWTYNLDNPPEIHDDLVALVAEVKKLRLKCYLAEEGEKWWKEVAVGNFEDEDKGKRLVEEVQKLRAAEQVSDKIYDMYKQLISELPECPTHGECVPYAVDYLRGLKDVLKEYTAK